MGAVLAIAAVAAAGAAAAVVYLRSTPATRRTPEGQAALERAVAAIDRELAADLELMAMFDQTKQAFTLENAEFLGARDVVEREARAAFASVADVYERIPATEAAMERRGPVGSIADADRALIHAWEGDVREAQRSLRAALAIPRSSRWDALIARLGARFAAR